MFTPSTVGIWLSQQALPVAIVIGILIAGFLFLKFSASRRRWALTRQRAGHTEDTFVEQLSVHGFDPALSRATYRYLQNEQNVHFPIFATDLLDEDLGLDVEDLEQTKMALAAETRRDLRPGQRHQPIVTVEDLIRFVQAAPRRLAA